MMEATRDVFGSEPGFVQHVRARTAGGRGFLFLVWLVAAAGAGCATAPKPPVARVDPQVTRIHGDTRVDNYHWLRERNSAEVIEYLEAENRYTERMMAYTEALQEQLYEEMKARIKETDLDVPVRVDDWYYYSRTVAGKQYRIHCRRHGSLDAAEAIILDENRLAERHDYFRVGAMEVSPDHRLLAYTVDTAGDEVYTLYVKDLTTGGLLVDEVPGVYYSVVWGNDNRTLFYNTLDEAKRPFKAFRHALGTPASEDELVYHEPDERFFLRIGKTRSRRFVLLNLSSKITDEVRFLDADAPDGEFRVLQPRAQGVEYRVAHRGEHFYIVTNDEAVNFRLMKAPVTSPGKSQWTDVLPHRPGVKLDGVDAFANHLAVYERDRGLRRLRIMDLADGDDYYVAFDEPVYTFRAMDNEMYDTATLRFSYESLVTPRSVYDHDMNMRRRVLRKREPVLQGYDPSQYRQERVYAKATDGTQIPISMVYRRGVAQDGSSPMLLAGYGSYGFSYSPRFSSNRLSLLDRGFIYAIAHVRGGGEMGRPWYEAGKLLRKINTFTDFVACAEHLIAAKYTSAERLAITGGSAGGLLMGAVVNIRPELFGAVVARVPFVDVVNTMLDASIPLTVTEYEEWGDPRDAKYYEYMMTYSPYDNVRRQDYPPMLITAGLNDPRVQYWEPAKWTAKLRAMKTDDNVLLLKTNMGAGHGGASGRYDALRELAFQYAFIVDTLGVSPGV